MIKKIKKIYVSIMCSVVMIFGSWSSLKGQGNNSKVWDSLSEGKFEVTSNYRAGDYIVMTTVLDAATKPAIINNESALQPISVWDMNGDTFATFSNDWKGDPMNPVRMFMCDSSRLFITDGVKMVRADIDFQHKTISYNQTFQGSQGANLIRDMFIDKTDEKVYFISSTTKHYLYICNMLGEVQNTVQFADQAINIVKSIVRWKDTVYVGYTYDGGLPDGSGLATLDPLTGQITKIFDQPWKNNRNGCEVKVIDGRLYLTTDAAIYKFRQTLFEYKNGGWQTVIIGAWMPDFRQGKTVVDVEKNGCYPNGDTINKTSGGLYYEFINSLAGKEIPDDPRLNIQFAENFKTAFWQRNHFMPSISFIYQKGNKTIGFGDYIVANLKDPSSGIKTPKERVALKLYPNPSTGNSVAIQGLQKQTNYIITNATGQTVASGLTMEALDISSLQPGFYFITFPKIGASARLVRN